MYSDRCNSKYSFLPCDRKEMYILNDIMIDDFYSYSELLAMVKELQEELKELKEGVTV